MDVAFDDARKLRMINLWYCDHNLEIYSKIFTTKIYSYNLKF